MGKTPSTVGLILVVSAVAVVGCKNNNGADTRKGNTMYKKLTTNMMVEDVNRTVDFYSDILGFEFMMGVPENSQEVVTAKPPDRVLAFAVMKAGDVEMMFQAKQSLVEEIPEFDGMGIGGSLTFYVEVEDAEALYAKLDGKVTIVKDMQSRFYGKREFSIRDCNGYILTLAGNI
ncbi:MAG TPA: VOC family protein [Sedimentisphaerales bacterium]|nr:VOC family protein [Sedimentisphaerales bacterium]